MDSIIEINHLTKDFGHGRGVFDVSIDVKKGECFGYLGPNGAGKSTTIRMLMGFTRPDSGETLINGENTFKNRYEVMQKVSYIPGEVALPPLLKGKDVIKNQMELKNVKDTTFLNWLIKEFELDTSLLCKEMSIGMRRKLVIVCAFMSDPDIIIMDEPSSGLDPEMQDKFIELIKLEKKRGKTILLSSHIFREIDVSCDRIAIIKDGKIVSTFIADDLKHNTHKVYKVKFKDNSYYELKDSTSDIYKIVDFNEDNKEITFAIEDSNISCFVNLLASKEVLDFNEIKETLEDFFMKFYKEEKEFKGI